MSRAEADLRRLANRTEHDTLPAIAARREVEAAVLRDTVAEAERAIDGILAEEAGLAAKAAVIVSVPGVAIKTARVILAELPELGQLGPRAAAALCGLAPYRRDSGKTRKPAHVLAGRTALKRACYLAAFAAIRHNPWAKHVYQALRARGKPAKVAIIAVARRLVVILNAMVRDNAIWKNKTV